MDSTPLTPTNAGGLHEVQRLEAARAKRAFEATLPPIDDLSQLPLRQAMIEQWEAKEWAERSEEIRRLQEERLVLLQQALQVRCMGMVRSHTTFWRHDTISCVVHQHVCAHVSNQAV